MNVTLVHKTRWTAFEIFLSVSLYRTAIKAAINHLLYTPMEGHVNKSFPQMTLTS